MRFPNLALVLLLAGLTVGGCGVSQSTYTVVTAGEVATVNVNTRAGKVGIEVPTVGNGRRRGTASFNGQSFKYEIQYEQRDGQFAIKSVVIDGKEIQPATP